MCSLHLTHPSAHTWSSGQPTLRRPGVRGLAQGSHLNRGLFLPEPGFEPTTLGYPYVSSPTRYPLGHGCPKRVRKKIRERKNCREVTVAYVQNIGAVVTLVDRASDL